MEEPSYPTLELSRRIGVQWPNIEATRKLSTQELAELKKVLADLDSEDISIVVFGSLARKEFTQDSDIDWCLLVDGIADPHHHDLFLEAHKRIKLRGHKDSGREKTFATLVSSHNLIQNVGREGDTNNNLTRRMLLLLESTPITGQIAHERVVKNVLKRYLIEDRSFWQGMTDRHHIPHFLLNDFARFWRTMAVDFAYKLRSRSGEQWAIRNVKLRMSRKLLYVAGLLGCFQCNLLWEEWGPETRDIVYQEESFRPEVVDIIHSIFSPNPLDIVAEFFKEHSRLDPTAAQLFRAYDEYLGIMLSSDQRSHLENLGEADGHSDTAYAKAREMSHRFRDALLDLFFGETLKPLTRLYGVF